MNNLEFNQNSKNEHKIEINRFLHEVLHIVLIKASSIFNKTFYELFIIYSKQLFLVKEVFLLKNKLNNNPVILDHLFWIIKYLKVN